MPHTQVNHSTFPTFEFTEAYIDALRRGDPATTEHFFRYFSRALSCNLRRRICSPALIEDIQQETFTRVLRTVMACGIQRAECFGSFVFAVSRNVAREYLRRSGPVEPAEGHERADTHPDPEALAHAAELKVVLSRTMALLADRDRRVLSMALIEDMTYEEIAQQLRAKRSSIPLLVHRAKCRLRERLTPMLSGGALCRLHNGLMPQSHAA